MRRTARLAGTIARPKCGVRTRQPRREARKRAARAARRGATPLRGLTCRREAARAAPGCARGGGGGGAQAPGCVTLFGGRAGALCHVSSAGGAACHWSAPRSRACAPQRAQWRPRWTRSRRPSSTSRRVLAAPALQRSAPHLACVAAPWRCRDAHRPLMRSCCACADASRLAASRRRRMRRCTRGAPATCAFFSRRSAADPAWSWRRCAWRRSTPSRARTRSSTHRRAPPATPRLPFALITLFVALERAADARVVLCGAGDGQDRRPAGCRIHDGQGVGGADGQARVAGARRCSLCCQLPPSLRRRAHAASLRAPQKHERLEAELNAAKANSVKARGC